VRLAGLAAAGTAAKKKSLRAKELQDPAVQAERNAWQQRTAALDPDRLIFLDQSNARTDLTRLYGRAPRGERVVGYVPHRCWQATTMMGLLRHDGTTAVMTYEGGTDLAVMQAFIGWQLRPVVRPGDIVVMDRLAAHRSPTTVAAIEALGAEVWLLPPYSPDFNPIEKLWSKVKAFLRKTLGEAKETLDELIGQAFATITASDADHWFAHCGYRNTQT
jgi:transposase InsO family protein